MNPARDSLPGSTPSKKEGRVLPKPKELIILVDKAISKRCESNGPTSKVYEQRKDFPSAVAGKIFASFRVSNLMSLARLLQIYR